MKATIDEIKIGKEILGQGTTGHIADKTSNSVQLFLKASTPKGICCYQWVTLEDFNKQYQIKS